MVDWVQGTHLLLTILDIISSSIFLFFVVWYAGFMDFQCIRSVGYLSHLYLVALNKTYILLSQLPGKRTTFIPYLPGPATHPTGAGRVLDGVRDPTQGSASVAFGCTGPGLVPVLPARCHRRASVDGSLRYCGRVLYFPSSYQKTACHYPTSNNTFLEKEYIKFCWCVLRSRQGNTFSAEW
jgi:hypothetical protein